jgi:hypothetical protein
MITMIHHHNSIISMHLYVNMFYMVSQQHQKVKDIIMAFCRTNTEQVV